RTTAPAPSGVFKVPGSPSGGTRTACARLWLEEPRAGPVRVASAFTIIDGPPVRHCCPANFILLKFETHIAPSVARELTGRSCAGIYLAQLRRRRAGSFDRLRLERTDE